MTRVGIVILLKNAIERVYTLLVKVSDKNSFTHELEAGIEQLESISPRILGQDPSLTAWHKSSPGNHLKPENPGDYGEISNNRGFKTDENSGIKTEKKHLLHIDISDISLDNLDF